MLYSTILLTGKYQRICLLIQLLQASTGGLKMLSVNTFFPGKFLNEMHP